jgi:hypothetical protein
MPRFYTGASCEQAPSTIHPLSSCGGLTPSTLHPHLFSGTYLSPCAEQATCGTFRTMSEADEANSVQPGAGTPTPGTPARVPSEDQAKLAQARWASMPESIRNDIDTMTKQMTKAISGPETSDSFDVWVNQWLRPHGLCQLTTWNPITRRISTQVTTLEALEAMK